MDSVSLSHDRGPTAPERVALEENPLLGERPQGEVHENWNRDPLCQLEEVKLLAVAGTNRRLWPRPSSTLILYLVYLV